MYTNFKTFYFSLSGKELEIDLSKLKIKRNHPN